ncbi:MAG: hypothetical protein FWE66_00030 [Oscillospiraceae bacterium]|nr:hypothetical protein [Oscillospiraceae bacterium]
MKKKKNALFGQNITPACEYCSLGKNTADGKMVLCSRAGVVSPYYRCKKFIYSPVRRKPKSHPRLPDMDPSDFTL